MVRTDRVVATTLLICLFFVATVVPLCAYVYPDGYKSSWGKVESGIKLAQNTSIVLLEYSYVVLADAMENWACFVCKLDALYVFRDLTVSGVLSTPDHLCIGESCIATKKRNPRGDVYVQNNMYIEDDFVNPSNALFSGTISDTITWVSKILTVGIYNTVTTLSHILYFLNLNLWKGDWVSTDTYNPDDFAIYNNQLYQAVSETTNSTPFAGSTVWIPMGNGSGPYNYTGVQGADGQSATCQVAADFVSPGVNASVNVSVSGYTGWASVSQFVYVEGSGQYQILAIQSPTAFLLENVGYNNDTPAGVTVTAGASITASGKIGPSICNGINYKCSTYPSYGAVARIPADVVIVCNTSTPTVCGTSSTIQSIFYDPSLSNWTGYISSGFLANGTYVTPVSGAYRWNMLLNAKITFAATSGSGWQPQVTLVIGASVQFDTYHVTRTSNADFHLSMTLQRTRFQNAGDAFTPSWRVSIVQTNATITLLPTSTFSVVSMW
jgi:hypothetical protein